MLQLNGTTAQRHKIANFLPFFLIAALFTFLFSCDPTNLQPNSNLKQSNNVEVIDGTLHFQDYETIQTLQTEFSNMSDNERDEWEESIGFVSFRRVFNQSSEEFFELQTRDEYDQWLIEYNDILYMKEDKVQPFISQYFYQLISNRNGEFYVGTELVKVQDDKLIRIFDGNRSKIKLANTMDKPSKDLGIDIIKFPNSELISTRSDIHGSCDPYNPEFWRYNDDEDRRVYLELSIVFLPLNPYIPQVVNSAVEIHVFGYKKGLFGGFNKYKTNLAYDQVGFEMRNHDNLLFIRGDYADEDYNSKDLYGYITGLGTSFNINDPIYTPYFQKSKGRATSRAMILNTPWLVMCCGYATFDCPDETDAPFDPF